MEHKFKTIMKKKLPTDGRKVGDRNNMHLGLLIRNQDHPKFKLLQCSFINYILEIAASCKFK